MRPRSTLLLGAMLSLIARSPAWPRQDVRVLTGAYGTASRSSTTISSAAFHPLSSAEGFEPVAVISRSATGPGSEAIRFQAPLALPDGVAIERFTLSACDASATAEVTAQILSYQIASFGTTVSAVRGTGVAGTPDCSTFSLTLDPAMTVDNAGSSYVVEITDGDRADTTSFRSVRVEWRRQVRPADAGAEFTDVPLSDTRRRYVEAATVAGVMKPCAGATRFCPDDPVTRGQLGIILARALGLHFPD